MGSNNLRKGTKMNRFKKKFKKQYILIAVLIILVLSFAIVGLAEYLKGQNSAKRVVANIAGMGQLFDSNYLMSGPASLTTISFPKTQTGKCVIDLKIYNYFHSDPGKAYQGALTYKLVAQLVNEQGNPISEDDIGSYSGQIGISADNGSNYTYFVNYDSTNGYYLNVGTDVKGGSEDIPYEPDTDGKYKPTDHSYKLCFPVTFLTVKPDIYIKLTAIPSDARELSSISGILGVSLQGESLNQGWDGMYNDSQALTGYDGLNYLISGSGKASITIRWDSRYIDINQYNLSDYSLGTPTTKTIDGVLWKELTFNANSDDELDPTDPTGETVIRKGISRYDLQFYLTEAGTNQLDALSDDAEQYWLKANSFIVFSSQAIE